MKNWIILILIQGILSGFNLHAQKKDSFEVTEGSLDFLKGQKILLVTYDYNNMSVGVFPTEEEYINKKVTELNASEPGKGDKWKIVWINRRSEDYEPAFEMNFNKFLESTGISCSKDAKDAEINMKIHTVFLDGGSYPLVGRLDAIITFSKATSGEEIAVVFANRCYGKGYFLKDAYASLGKKFAKFLMPNL
ncbi:MAG: hypothetical protein V2B15_19450 [Bacteroidota bacterium]